MYSVVRVVLLALAVAVAGCDEEEPLAGPDPDPEEVARAVDPQLYATCGDPACSGWVQKGLPRCRSRQEGDVCNVGALGQECDPHDFCNVTLVCSDVDPTADGCPISLRSAKKDIDYLDPAGRDALHDQLMAVRLATWRYNQEAASSPTHLGFIIDDVLPSPAVGASGERVDLYAYTSMAVAALQVQSQQIKALEAEIRALKAAR